MVLNFFKTGTVWYAMIVLSVLGVFSKALETARLRKLLRQTGSMGTVKDKYLKQWKVKFENLYRSSGQVENIPIYVEKNLKQYRFMGIRLGSFGRVNRLTATLVGLLGAASSFLIYWYGGESRTVSLYVISGILLGGAMLWWEQACDTAGKEKRLELFILDYYENILAGRLRSGRQMTAESYTGENEQMRGAEESGAERTVESSSAEAAMTVGAEPSDIECSTDRLRTQEEAAGREPDEAAFRKRLERIASGRKDGKPRKLTEEEEHLIEDIIQEYLYE